MPIKTNEFAIGQKYKWQDPGNRCDVFEITIIGFDPYNKKWVAACNEWCMGISHIDTDDIEFMELI